MSILTSNIVNTPRWGEVKPRSADARGQLLIIDPHPEPILADLRDQFGPRGYRITSATTAMEALESIKISPPELILLDPRLPDQGGLEIHGQIRNINPRIPVIFIARSTTADAAIEAMKQGAYDFLIKPVEEGELHRVVSNALEIERQRRSSIMLNCPAPVSTDVEGALCGGCPMMREVFKSIGRVAGQNVTVLVTGESGTGKELVARAIHRHSSRAGGPFLALNCAAIPDNLLESELFGHEKGAFSGADRRRIGKFEECDGGTILLDEIGDMPLLLQAKILRLLQEQSFERVGGNETIHTNVRLIASTHRDLKTWSAEGKFRGDLYYRLSVLAIHLPPLRERMDDLPILVRHFLRQFSRESGQDAPQIAQEAMERLLGYHWPGNIRELQSVLRQALLRSNGQGILPAFLPMFADTVTKACPQSTSASAPNDFDLDDFLREHLRPGARDLYADLLRELDRHSLARVLTYTRGNRQLASQILGIARQTLRMKLRESGLHVTQSVECEEEVGAAY